MKEYLFAAAVMLVLTGCGTQTATGAYHGCVQSRLAALSDVEEPSDRERVYHATICRKIVERRCHAQELNECDDWRHNYEHRIPH